MDSITEYLVSYATSIRYEDIPSEVIHKLKVLLIDSLACGIMGYYSEPAKIACRIAERVKQCELPATILGSGRKSSPELAAFVNGVMIRYLDLNDGYESGSDRGGGHPSDNFAAVLTCADSVHTSGKNFIIASVLAYEVFCRIADKVTLVPKGFDQAVIAVISGVIGVSRILGLTREQMLQALNMAIVSNIVLGQTREGKLSMWKGCAVANASRNAVFAAFLAKEGMTGPDPVFNGLSGFFKVVDGPFKLDGLGGDGRPFSINKVIIKRYPCGMVAQTAIDAAIKIRSKISSIDEIAEINIGTFSSARNAMADSDEKWHPSTRETADHSLPYVVAVALMHGNVEVMHFDNEYLNNPALINLMKRIKVEVNEECDKLHPSSSCNRVEVITGGGKIFSEMVQYHHGHYKDPLTDAEIENKFNSLTKKHISPAQRKELLSLIWNLEQVDDASRVMQLCNKLE